MKTLLAALLAVCLAAPAALGATSLPAPTLDEFLARGEVSLIGMKEGACRPGDFASAFAVLYNGGFYKLILVERPDKNEVKFYLLDSGEGDTSAWVGHVVDGRLAVEREYRYSQIEAMGPSGSLCNLLYEGRA